MGQGQLYSLVPQLNKRAGIFKKIWNFLPKRAMRKVTSGNFASKIQICLTVMFPGWHDVGYKESALKEVAISKVDVTTIQWLQNIVISLLVDTKVGIDLQQSC